MPVISAASPAILVQQVVTTTLYPNGTAPIIKTTGSPTTNGAYVVPKGPIIGGIVAGATLAFMVVVGWKLWGKSIKKTQKKQALEVEKTTMTMSNTRRNAGRRTKPSHSLTSTPDIHKTSERRVQFVQQMSEKMSEVGNMALRSMSPTPRRLPQSTQTGFGEKPPSSFRSSYSTGAPKDPREDSPSCSESSSSTLVESTPLIPPAIPPRAATRAVKPKTVRQKPTMSSIDSESVYSTQSVTEVPPSWATTAWNRYSVMSRSSWSSGRGGGGHGRFSQISQESRSSAAPSFRTANADASEMPVGIAY